MTDPPSSPEIVAISPPPSPRPGTKRRRGAGDEPSSKRATSSAPASATPSSSSRASSAPARPKTVTAPDSRSRVTERMLKSLSSNANPITHSDAFERTAHVHSCSTGHQQRGGDRGFWASAREAGFGADVSESATYWSVRTAKVEAQSREKKTDLLAGCVIAINGHTGPVSNLQLQNLITSNGGRFAPHQHSGCTHVVAERLAGGKTQKYINGQGGRGASRRAKVVRVEWVLDSVAQGRKLSEAGYMVIADPSQKSLFSALGMKPKAELRAAVKGKGEDDVD